MLHMLWESMQSQTTINILPHLSLRVTHDSEQAVQTIDLKLSLSQ